jgi:hypothetical protein
MIRSRVHKITVSLILMIICAAVRVPAQNTAAEEKKNNDGAANPVIYYTYAGPLLSIGSVMTEREVWSESSGISTVENSLLSYSGGFLLAIFTDTITGEFTLQYIHHTGDESGYSMLYTASGKYMFTAAEKFYIYPAAGIYFTTPPSGGPFGSGGGLHSAIGALYDTTVSTKLFGEWGLRYGYDGTGAEGTSLGFSFTLGFIFRAGNI